jgi:hypothetical protein
VAAVSHTCSSCVVASNSAFSRFGYQAAVGLWCHIPQSHQALPQPKIYLVSRRADGGTCGSAESCRHTDDPPPRGACPSQQLEAP